MLSLSAALIVSLNESFLALIGSLTLTQQCETFESDCEKGAKTTKCLQPLGCAHMAFANQPCHSPHWVCGNFTGFQHSAIFSELKSAE